MAHSQLTLAQRYEIYAYLQANISKSRIAVLLNVHRSTVYREIKRNTVQGKYHPEKSHQAFKERKHKAKSRRLSDQAWHLIDSLLRLDFSPEQISGHLRRIGIYSVSHEWIYQHILADKAVGGDLWKHLRRSNKKRRKRYGKQDRRGSIPNRISIDKRPAIVMRKIRIGDWEIDLATGKGHSGYLVVAVERKSMQTLIKLIPDKKAETVTKAIIEMLMPYRSYIKTITIDNGKEFSNHEEIARELKTRVYFAHPYSAWERGLNENTIGLIRQYFPKNKSLDNIDSREVEFVQNKLNMRPRKTLKFRSPNEVFFNVVAFET